LPVSEISGPDLLQPDSNNATEALADIPVSEHMAAVKVEMGRMSSQLDEITARNGRIAEAAPEIARNIGLKEKDVLTREPPGALKNPPSPSAVVPNSFQDLVLRSQQDERGAMEELLFRIIPEIHRHTRLLLRNAAAADDATQETLRKFWKYLSSFQWKTEDQFHGWVYRIAINAARDQIRASQHPLAGGAVSLDGIEAREVEDYGENPEESYLRREQRARDRERLAESLSKLVENSEDSVKTISLIYLRDVEELDTKTVADMLGVAEGTVKSGLSRRHAYLREQLRPYYMSETAR